jgi:hypothetical protein
VNSSNVAQARSALNRQHLCFAGVYFPVLEFTRFFEQIPETKPLSEISSVLLPAESQARRKAEPEWFSQPGRHGVVLYLQCF